jgi:K+ transport systems, NAD-binding component
MVKNLFKDLWVWGLILILWVCFLCLGYIGWVQYELMNKVTSDIALDIYLTIQLVSMNSGAVAQPIPPALNIARFALPVLTLLTAIKAFIDLFKDQVNTIQLALLSGQVIICGLSRKGMLLATRFRRQGTEVVVIEQDEDNPWIESCREQGIFVLVGDASEPTLLINAGIHKARGLFAVCDDDGINADIAMQAKNLLNQGHLLAKNDRRYFWGSKKSRENQRFNILMHNANPQLVDLLRHYGLHQHNSTVQIILFNVFERAAFQLLDKHPAWDQIQIETGKEPHILLVGLGRMGENIILHAAEKWAACRPTNAARLHFTILDRHAMGKVESLGVRYPKLGTQCVFIPLQMEIYSPDFERGAFLFDSRGELDIDRIYISIDNDSLGLHAGLLLRMQLPQGVDIPIVIRMSEETGLTRLLEDHSQQEGEYCSLTAFGYLDHTCTPDLLK